MRKNRQDFEDYLKSIDNKIKKTSSYLKETQSFIARANADLKQERFVYKNIGYKELVDNIKTTDEAMVDAMYQLIRAKESRDLLKIKPLVELIKEYAATFGYDPTGDLKRILAR